MHLIVSRACTVSVCFAMPRVSSATCGLGGEGRERASWRHIRSDSGRNGLRRLRGPVHVSARVQAETAFRDSIDKGTVRSGPCESSVDAPPDLLANAFHLLASVRDVRCSILVWRGRTSRDSSEVGSTPPHIIEGFVIVPANFTVEEVKDD